jgi:hypothetical protein
LKANELWKVAQPLVPATAADRTNHVNSLESTELG